MLKYIFKRILLIIPVLIGTSFLVFTLLYLSPGDPAQIHAGQNASPELIQEFRVKHGLDKPFMEQYVTYIKDIVVYGDLGNSYSTSTPIIDSIQDTFPVTLRISVLSMTLMLAIGIPLGIISALRQYSILDNVVTVFGMIGVSIPNFWFALQLIMIFSLNLGWLPVSGIGTWKHLILPTAAAGLAGTASIMRTTRSAVLEVYQQDYIKTARAKGQKDYVVIWRHMLKNAAMPIITVIGGAFVGSLANSTVIETVFSVPGMSKLLVDSITKRDNKVVLGTVLILAVVASLVNLLTDIVYILIDPRIKSQFASRENVKKKVSKVKA